MPLENEIITHMRRYTKPIISCVITRKNIDSAKNKTNNNTSIIPYSILQYLLDDIHLVESFKPDLLVSLDHLTDSIIDIDKDDAALTHIFGYRKNGVDGIVAMTNNFKNFYTQNNHTALNTYYRKIYLVTLEIIDENSVEINNAEKNDVLIEIRNVTDSHPASLKNNNITWGEQ